MKNKGIIINMAIDIVIIIIFSIVLFMKSGPKSEQKSKCQVVQIDSCEYIVLSYWVNDQRITSITHKGNCNYCIERNKQSYGDKK
jgi:hypothetical protein